MHFNAAPPFPALCFGPIPYTPSAEGGELSTLNTSRSLTKQALLFMAQEKEALVARDILVSGLFAINKSRQSSGVYGRFLPPSGRSSPSF